MLSKLNYLAVNKVAFSNLNKQQKDEKYKIYQERYKLRTRESKSAPTLPKVVRPQKLSRPVALNTIKWSECLLAYAKASIDPFDSIQSMPCIPDSICAPSLKYRTFIDAEIGIGDTGVGYAAFNPWTMAVNDVSQDGTASDFPLVTTTTAYANSDISWLVSAPAGLAYYASNSPYEDFGNTALRLVAAGMEIEYTGQLLNQAGTISVCQWDGLLSVPNHTTISAFKSNPRTQVCAVSREARCYVRYDPLRTEDLSYRQLSDYQPTIHPDIASDGIYAPLIIVVSGATADTTFRVRAVAFFEAQGHNLPVTPSESDPIGFPAFQAARSQVLPTQDPKRDLFSILKDTAINIGKTITGFGPQIGTVLGSALGNPAAGAAIGSASKTIFESLFGS